MEHEFYTYPNARDTVKIAYSIIEVKDILGITLVKTYALLRSNPFPIILAMRTKLIPVAPFHKWVIQNYPQTELPEFNVLPDILVYEKKSYSVPEVRAMLGMKKTSSYELIKTGAFETITVNNNMRVKKESFDAWYHSQDNLFEKKEEK